MPAQSAPGKPTTGLLGPPWSSCRDVSTSSSWGMGRSIAASTSSSGRGGSRIMKGLGGEKVTFTLMTKSKWPYTTTVFIILILSSRMLFDPVILPRGLLGGVDDATQFLNFFLLSYVFIRAVVAQSFFLLGKARMNERMTVIWPLLLTNIYITVVVRPTGAIKPFTPNFKNRYLQRYMCLLRHFHRIWCILEPLSCTKKWTYSEQESNIVLSIIWHQMLTEMFAFITQSLLKTKQMAKSTVKVKMNSKSWEAIKMSGPTELICTITRCKQNLRSGSCCQFIWFHVSHGFFSRQ